MMLEFAGSEGLYVYDTETNTAILHNHPTHEQVTDEKILARFKFFHLNPNKPGANHYCEQRKEWFLTDSCKHCGFKPIN